jgi:membrane protein implicated in regulation of membrane protease activity
VSTGFKNRNLTMNAVTVAFLVVGGIGIAVLAASLLVGDLIHLGHPDADGPFSLPSVAAFVGAFGFGGALAASVVGSGTVAMLAGVVAGVAIAFPAALGTAALARAVSRMRTDATPTRADLVGRLGVVVTAITDGGYGEVRISIGGQPVKLNAQADRPVPLGAHVFVVEAPSDTSVVVEQTTPVIPKEEK